VVYEILDTVAGAKSEVVQKIISHMEEVEK